MKKLPILCNFFMRLFPNFFLVKNRSAGEINCGSHCVNKIGQIMKFISYSNGKTSFKSRVNTGTRLHRVRGIDWVSYLYTFSQILAVLPKWLDELSSYN